MTVIHMASSWTLFPGADSADTLCGRSVPASRAVAGPGGRAVAVAAAGPATCASCLRKAVAEDPQPRRVPMTQPELARVCRRFLALQETGTGDAR